MRFLATFLFALLLAALAAAQSTAINIIPKPQSLNVGSGHFKLDRKTKIVAGDDVTRKMAAILNDLLKRNYGFELEVTAKQIEKNRIEFIAAVPASQPSGAIVGESYTLTVTPTSILMAGTEAGIFYGIQSLMQMMPPKVDNDRIEIPAAEIRDEPRFRYRGMHLDVGRHFMPVSFVKKYIDLMAQYKFNNFHWHLTEDQGWRIEIKKYPRLTEIGSKRKETVKERNITPYIGDNIPVEGFYTQDEIRDVVAYAKARYITVIPEIELPGHSSAALAAYPEFGCKENYEYRVQTNWGIFKEVFCPTEKTFKFLEDVLTEVIDLFPDSPYIHIGGDEVLKDHWKESAYVQELKRREGLKDEDEVQSWFIRRIEKFINSKGKRIIGWDEILEGGLAPNATVMSWRGMRGGIAAAKAKHDVIMTPTDHAYFDYAQGDSAYEPISFPNYLPLERVYAFEPVPKELTAEEAKHVVGGQGNLWTEYIKTPQAAEYMLFPRMVALSEVLWSRPEHKDYADFLRRLGAHLPRLDKQNVNYRIPEPAGLQNKIVGAADGRTTIELTPFLKGSKIYYTLDGTTPSEKAKLYDGPISVELKNGEMRELKTIVVTPNGRKSSIYAATLARRDPLQPVELTEKKPGVTYEFLTGDDSTSQIQKGESRSILLNQFGQKHDLKKPFAVTFDGYFNVPRDGIYEFQIDSTWDATVVLGGEKIIDDAGTKDRKVRHAIVPLKAGLHKMSLRYNHRGGDASFRLRWAIKGEALRQAYGSEFVH